MPLIFLAFWTGYLFGLIGERISITSHENVVKVSITLSRRTIVLYSTLVPLTWVAEAE